MAAAAVAQIVPIHAGNDHIVEFQRGYGFGQVFGLVHIQRIGSAMADIAKRAAARAFVAHDHEGSGAAAKAFADIGATGFFTHGVQIVFAQDALDFVKARIDAAGFDADPIGFFQHRRVAIHLNRNTGELGLGFLFQTGIVFGRSLRGADGVGAVVGHGGGGQAASGGRLQLLKNELPRQDLPANLAILMKNSSMALRLAKKTLLP